MLLQHLIPVLTLCVLPIQSKQKLPNNVVPQKYAISNVIDPKSLLFTGKVVITVRCKTNTVTTMLHGKEKYGHLVRKDVKVSHSESAVPLNVEKTTYDKESDVLTIHTSELKAGNLYDITIQYEGEISKQHDYVVWREKNEYIIATNFPRQYAFPCFDEPNLKANFNLRLTINTQNPDKTYTYSNAYSDGGKKTHAVQISPPKVQDTYFITQKLSPSQISFVVTNVKLSQFCADFEMYSTVNRQGKSNACFKYKKELGENMINEKNSLVKNTVMKYKDMVPASPLPVVTFIIVPGGDRFVSINWGLVVISDWDFRRGTYAELKYKIWFRMAKQYFGGMVSPDSWDSKWLFKALAKYFAGMQALKDPFSNGVLDFMIKKPNEELRFQPDGGQERFQKGIESDKGVMLLRMVHVTLGDTAFIKAIQEFIETYKYKSAGPNQLWEIFDKVSKEPEILPDGITWSVIMRTWTEQPGFPVVTIKDNGDGQFTISQVPYYGGYDKNTEQQKDETGNGGKQLYWWINLPYAQYYIEELRAFSGSKRMWLGSDTKKKVTILSQTPNANNLVIFNTKYSDLYVVKYEMKTWQRIVDTVRGSNQLVDHFTRAQLVHDVFALAIVNNQDFEYVCTLHRFLEKETNEKVWKAFFNKMEILIKLFKASPETYKVFQLFVKETVRSTFDGLKEDYIAKGKNNAKYWSEVQGKTDYQGLFNNWGCTVARNDYCRQQALLSFEIWMQDPKSLEEKFWVQNMKTIICTVLSEPHTYAEVWSKQFEFFFSLLKTYDKDPWHRTLFSISLKCLNDKIAIERLLAWITSPTDDKATQQEKEAMFVNLAIGMYSFAPTLDYFYNNFDNIQKYHKDAKVLANFVRVLTCRLKPEQVSKMEEFLKSKELHKQEKIIKALEYGKDYAYARNKWLSENDSVVRDLLTKTYCQGQPCKDASAPLDIVIPS